MSDIRVIKDKRDFYSSYNEGLFGNRALSWNSYPELLKSDYRGKVCVRNRMGSRANKTGVIYDISIEEAQNVMNRWIREGVKIGDIQFNQSLPNNRLLLQGELMRSIHGFYLFYSTIKKPMNLALAEESFHAEGLNAKMILKGKLWPSSYDDVMALFDIYPDSVVELGAYEVEVGNIPNRNTLIWEVRNF